MFFEPLRNILRFFATVEVGQIFKIALTPAVEDFIIELNTTEQLFKKGIDSLGVNLEDIGGGYSAFTIFLKNQKGQPVDRVTLKDSGQFYSTFEVTAEDDGFVIEADTLKAGGDDLEDRWGNNIIGLTEGSKDQLVEYLIPLIIEIVKREMYAVNG